MEIILNGDVFWLFEMGSCGDDEIFGSEFFVADSDGVRVKKISRTAKADYASRFDGFFVVAACSQNGL